MPAHHPQRERSAFRGDKFDSEKHMHRTKGFTLIELIIVVCIIGVLASIAYPSYMNSVRKSNRGDAIASLNDVAMRLQRCFTVNSTFASAAGACEVKDRITGGIPETSDAGLYEISGAAGDFTATTFKIKAVPIVGKRQEKDKDCAVFWLTHAGVKAAENQNGGDTTSKCW